MASEDRSSVVAEFAATIQAVAAASRLQAMPSGARVVEGAERWSPAGAAAFFDVSIAAIHQAVAATDCVYVSVVDGVPFLDLAAMKRVGRWLAANYGGAGASL